MYLPPAKFPPENQGAGRNAAERRACSPPTSRREDRRERLIDESAEVEYQASHGQDDGRDEVVPSEDRHPVGVDGRSKQ